MSGKMSQMPENMLKSSTQRENEINELKWENVNNF